MRLSGGVIFPTRNPILRLLGSLWTGMTLITLILVYSCVFSALAQVRFALELTEMAAFAHWLFTGLVLVMCVCVTIATLTRIPLSTMNLGVWIIHTGLLTLSAGAILYFGAKVEGDVLLESPRVELVSNANQRELARLLAAEGESWANFMPRAGGQVAVRVDAVESEGGLPAQRVTLTARSGESAAQTMQLTPAAPQVALNEQVSLRLRTFGPQSTFYDKERAALFVRRADQQSWTHAELHGLPIYRERYADEGAPLTDVNGRAIPSRRVTPAISLAGISIPTGWFEAWRLPIDTTLADVPFDVSVISYVPFVEGLTDVPAGGGSVVNPALLLAVDAGGQIAGERALFAMDPARSAWAEPGIELRWAATPEQREAWLSELTGPDELLIETLDPPTRQVLAVVANQTIAVEGTPYSLTIQQLLPDWPMMSPGYEGASSPALLVSVDNGQTEFSRTVIERFPELIQDIDETGQRLRDRLVDSNIRLRYRAAGRGGRWIIVGEPGGALTLGAFDKFGKVSRQPLTVGTPASAPLLGQSVRLIVRQFFERARRVEAPVLQPLSVREATDPRAASAIRVRITGKGPLAGWSDLRWITFSPYPDVQSRPLVVQPPATPQAWELVYSRVPHALGAELIGERLRVNFFPGRSSADTWQSDFYFRRGSEPYAKRVVLTNRTSEIGDWTLFQSGAARDHWSYTVLGVGNRRGMAAMALGSTLIPVGSLYAFYLKPVLRRRRQQEAIARAAAAAPPGAAEGPRSDRADFAETHR